MYVADSIYFLFLTVLIFGFIHNNIVVTWFGVASIILLPLCYVGRSNFILLHWIVYVHVLLISASNQCNSDRVQ